MLAMGQERASKIITQCDAAEIRALMAAAETLGDLSEELLESLVDEFEALCDANDGVLESTGALQSIIEEALTPEQKAELSVGPGAAEMALRNSTIWELLDRIKQEDLIDFLLEEHPQVGACVLSKLPTKKSAEIISMIEGQPRQDILAAMMVSRAALPEAIEVLEDILKERFSRSLGVKAETGGGKQLAGMFNELDVELSDNLFEELSEIVQPQRIQMVKSLMFRFGDLPTLDKTDVAKVVDEVPTDIMTIALRDTDLLIRDLVLDSMGQRTRRMMEAELSTPSSNTPEDIKTAQKTVASAVLGLASAGAIKIPEPQIAA